MFPQHAQRLEEAASPSRREVRAVQASLTTEEWPELGHASWTVHTLVCEELMGADDRGGQRRGGWGLWPTLPPLCFPVRDSRDPRIPNSHLVS